MARFTQYVGLNDAAHKYLESHNAKRIGSWKMAIGIGYEDVMGNIYEVSDDLDSFSCHETYAEIEDMTPWSSGPIIHTALRNLATGEVRFRWNPVDIHWD